MTKRILLLDCDGVLCDCATPVHRFAQKLLRRELPGPELWKCFDFCEAMKLTEQEARDFRYEILGSEVAFEIKLYGGAAELVHQLKEMFDVCFVTAGWNRMPAWVVAREHLLEQFGCDVVFTHAKHRIPGQILVDDKASTIEKGGSWRGILYRRPWNSLSKYADVIESLEEVLKL